MITLIAVVGLAAAAALNIVMYAAYGQPISLCAAGFAAMVGLILLAVVEDK